MYLQNKHLKSSMSQNKLLGDGRKKVKLKLKKPMVDIEDTKLSSPIKKELNLSMQEFPVGNKVMISKDKLNSSKTNIKDMKLSLISEVELISKEKDLNPFWNSYSKKMSQKLWLPTLIDGVDSDLSSSSGCFTNMEHNSFLFQKNKINQKQKNYPKISCQSLLSSQQGTMVKENITFSRKIRIYPNKNQKLFFEKCFGTTRYFYNRTIDFINTSEDIKWTLPFLRKNVMKSDKNLNNNELWQKEIPYDTRQLAIKDVLSAYKGCFTLLKNKQIKKFDMKFKSKKQPTQIFHITKKAIDHNLNLFKRRLNKSLRTRKRMTKWIQNNIKTIKHDCILIREKPNRYYLHISDERKVIEKEDKNEIVSLDPGVRTFQTFYSPNGVYGKMGNNKIDELYKFGKKLDNLISHKTKVINKKTKRNLNDRCFKLRTKIKNTVSDMHWKTASYLCKNYNYILLPNFETQKMSKKIDRNINHKSVRMMMTLSHYKFKEKLKYKSKCYKNCKVLDVSESWTSKTCGKCGNINNDLRGAKIYSCKICKIKIDRDVNGARNILLKNIG